MRENATSRKFSSSNSKTVKFWAEAIFYPLEPPTTPPGFLKVFRAEFMFYTVFGLQYVRK
jgi:hypothetical protein